ncbi:MAG: DNA/RNA nuclease SfsA [Aquificaceae bacterium]|nr:DNA/RNA nuclease SfsA [Aquificaceae bacterium]MCX8060861.1 DNA/RNA nuclease SfsA [Aquificaceae bacterium]MDW8096986.1 DNA/RNA nuclease SfsA [Aquificaceae bacterium]
MKFPPLVEAKFVERKNRFVALVELKGRLYSAYVRNTGRLTELLYGGNRVYLAERGGKHPYEITLASYGHHLVCVDSHLTPKLLGEFLGVAEFEPKFGEVRFDLLWKGRPVEVKSVNLVRGRVALFPDAPTPRGRRHIRKLIELSKLGHEPLLVFVVQREDGEVFSPNRKVDPDFAQALEEYLSHGLEVRAYRCSVSLEEIKIKEQVPISLEAVP